MLISGRSRKSNSLKAQVSGLRSQVSSLKSQVSEFQVSSFRFQEAQFPSVEYYVTGTKTPKNLILNTRLADSR